MNSEVVTRRKLFSGMLAVGAVAVASGTRSTALASVQDTSHFHVLTPSSPGFAARLDALFPGLRRDPHFGQIAAMSYLVTNRGPRSAYARSTHWAFTTSEGKYERTLHTMFRPSFDGSGTMVLPRKARGMSVSGNSPVLEPGMTRLVTPFFAWSPGYYTKHQSRLKWNKLLGRNARVAFYAALAAKSPAVSVHLSEVITSRKRVAKHGIQSLSTRYRIQRHAEHDAAVSVHKLLTAQYPDQQILSLPVQQARGFTRDHQGKPLDPLNRNQALYYKARQR